MSEAPKIDKPRKEHVGLRPPQFRLRTLLLAVTALAVLLAAAKFWSAAVVLFVVFFLVAILLHIAGNALGTQLRENSGADRSPGREARQPMIVPADLPPATDLGGNRALGQPILIVTIVLTVASIAGGCFWTWYHYGRHAHWENYLVAVVAFGLLGAIWSYLLVGFVQVLGGAILQAIRGHNREERAKREQEH